nr:PorP/SprF family type IX secretion system membrane protein [uncultured Carboxylicivirga sp.]
MTEKNIKTIYNKLVFLLMILLNNVGYAQNIHFSNVYVTHLTLNPANIGNFIGDMRVVGLYRAQGTNISKPYSTFYTSFEKPFFPFGEQIDFGIYYSYDNSAGNTLPAHYLYLSLAKKLKLSQSLSFSTGIQLGYNRRMFDGTNETFPDQYNRDLGSFDPHLPTSELFEMSTSSSFSAGVGFLAIKTFNGKNASIGYSMQNINRPNDTFFNIEYKTNIRNVFHLKVDYTFADHFFALPALVLIMQGKAKQSLLGTNIGYDLKETSELDNIMAGVFVRNGILNDVESLIFAFGFSYHKWRFFTSYDYDISGLKKSYSNSNGFEFGLVYILPSSSIRNIIHPSERF